MCYQLQLILVSRFCRYMCKLSDKDLRIAGTRSMSEFMWTAVKDPLDSHLSFDKEGLDLAFKYFTSTTLTMRLAGIVHINVFLFSIVYLSEFSCCINEYRCCNFNVVFYRIMLQSTMSWSIVRQL